MPVPFTIDFTAPNAATSLTATPVTVSPDPSTAAVDLAWGGISTSPENTERIEIWAEETNNEGVVVNNRVAYFTNPAIASFRWHFPRSGIATTYRVIQVVRSGGSTLNGLWATVVQTVTFPFLSLVSVKRPLTHRIPIRYWTTQRESLLQSQEWQLPAGGANFVEQTGSLAGAEFPLTFQFIEETGLTAEQQMQLVRLVFYGKDTMGFRDPRGHKHFGRFNGNVSADYGKGGVRYSGDFTFRRTSYAENL